MGLLLGLVSIITFPIRMLVNRPKQTIILIIVGVAIFSGYRVLSANKPQTVETRTIAPYELKQPKAKYAIQTSSRLYFTNNLTDQSGIVKATGYWDYTKKEWVYHKTVLTLDRKYYGNVEVYLP